MLNSKSLLNIKSLCVYYKTNDLKNSTIKLYLFSTPKKIFVFDEINSKLRHACSKIMKTWQIGQHTGSKKIGAVPVSLAIEMRHYLIRDLKLQSGCFKS